MSSTYELLSEEGLAGVTVDAVARRSGVAKTTIYRHWPSREALLLDACAQMGPHFDVPDTGSFPNDLRALGQRVVDQLLSGPYAAILLSLMDAAERNPDLAALLAAAETKLVEAVRAISERARVRGELRRLPESSDVAALIVGPLLYRRLFSHEPISEGLFRLIVDNVVRTAGATRMCSTVERGIGWREATVASTSSAASTEAGVSDGSGNARPMRKPRGR